MKKVFENKWFTIGLIVLASVIIYKNSISYPFIYDDIGYIRDNNFIKDPKNMTKLFSIEYFESGELSYRPVVTLSYIIGHYLGGGKSYGYRLLNILLYIFIIITFYFLCVKMFNDKIVAFLSAFFFLAHPVHTEVLMQVSFNEEIFVTLFVLIAFYYHIKDKIIFSSLFFLLSLFSKEVGIGFPLIVLFYDIIKNNKISIKKYIGYFICLILYIFVRFYALKGIAPELGYIGGSFYKNILTMSKVFIAYIKLLFLPVYLRPTYYFEIASSLFQPKVLLSLIFIFTFVIGIIVLLKRNKDITFCMVWFLITIAPVMNFIPFLKYSFLAERYLFLPSVGFCMFLGLMMKRLNFSYFKKNATLLISLNMVILLFYITQTIARTYEWKDEFTFWSKAVIRESKSFEAHTNLGGYYVVQNKIDLAIKEFETATELHPLPGQFASLGYLYLKKGLYNKAIEKYKIALQSNISDKSAIHNNIGFCYLQKGLYDLAIKEYKEAIKIRPNHAGYYYTLADIYSRLSEKKLSQKYLQIAKSLDN